MAEFNIEVEAGKTVRLPTTGKYCDRDIVVTATGSGTSDDGITGVWLLNENPDFTTMPYSTKVFFATYNKVCSEMRASRTTSSSGVKYTLYYQTAKVYSDNKWTDEVNRVIEILKTPDSQEFIDWLKANATKVDTISFSINGTSVYATKGMTWGDWVNSPYSPSYYVIGDDGLIYYGDPDDGWYVCWDDEEEGVLDTDAIVAGYDYYEIA